MSFRFHPWLWAALLTTSICVAAPAAQPDIAQLEQQVLERINQIRTRNELQPLSMDQELRRIARDYSEAMGQREFFSHRGPEGDTVGDRVRDAGFCYRAVAENLAKNYNVPDPAAAAVRGWMKSEGHRHNILTPGYRSTGIGIWRTGETYYFTQVFLRAFPDEVDCDRVRRIRPSRARE